MNESQPRSVASQKLLVQKEPKTISKIIENIQDALKKLSSNKAKTICVFGSLYHVGYVLSKN